MKIDAAMKEKSYFPNQDSSYDSMPEYEQLRNFEEFDFSEVYERVNS